MRPYLLAAVAVITSVAGCTDGTGLFGGALVEGSDSVFVIERADLSEGGAKPEEPPGDPVVVGPFVLRASVVPVDTSATSPPMSLDFVVKASTSAVLDVEGCAAWPRVYASPTRTAAPAWVVPGATCAQAPYADTIAPGGEAAFDFFAQNAMVEYALPDGRYYASVHFRMAEDSVVLTAGSFDVRLRTPGLSYHVTVRQREDGAVASVVATNLNPTPTYVEWGACSVGLALYRDPGRTDLAALWSQGTVCPSYLAFTTLAPGGRLAPKEFVRHFSSPELRRASELAAGRYYLAVNLGVNCHAYRFPAGVVQVW